MITNTWIASILQGEIFGEDENWWMKKLREDGNCRMGRKN